jgi:hypothetical protein
MCGKAHYPLNKAMNAQSLIAKEQNARPYPFRRAKLPKSLDSGLVATFSDCNISPELLSGTKFETTRGLRSQLLSIRQLGGKRKLTTNTNCLDP